MPDEYLTVAEIADLLRVNQQTIRNWIDRGELPAVRVGARRVRIARQQLEEFLANSQRPPRHDEESARWKAVRSASTSVGVATRARDLDALDAAIVQLVDAAQELRSGGRENS